MPLGYAAILAMGVVLGLLGGGGSILAIPILLYLFHTGMPQATTYSLLIVGSASAVGAIFYLVRKKICYKSLIFFGLPSVISTVATKRFLLPLVPSKINAFNEHFTKDSAILALFTALLITVAIRMIRPGKAVQTVNHSRSKLAGLGLLLGLVTGILGAGGGFVIIPALIAFAGLEMKTAVGTSLVIIAINALTGFASVALYTGQTFDTQLLVNLAMASTAGILLGSFLSKYADGNRLKPAFGWMILATGCFMILKETNFFRL